MSNFNNTPVTEHNAYHPEGLPADPGTASFFQQRVWFGYRAKVDDRLKLVSKFEVDYAYFGDAPGSNQVNLKTKNLYLDFTCPISGINAKVGMQDYASTLSACTASPPSVRHGSTRTC